MNNINVEISANVSGFQQGMQQASDSVKQYETDQRKVADASVNFRKELAKARREAQNLALAYSKLDKEARNSAFGREMKRQLDAAKQSAAELVDMNGDIRRELSNMASDTQTLNTVAEGFGVLINAASAASGVIATFTGNEEDAQKAVVLFTTAQSTLNTVTALANALQMESNTMIAIGKIQTLAAAAASQLKAAADTKGAVALGALTIAQRVFNAVANANPYVLLATAALTLIGIIGTLIGVTGDAAEEEERLEEQAEKARQEMERQQEVFVGAATESHALAGELEYLYDTYKKSNSEIEKTAVLERAAKAFNKLGIECNSVSDAQKILLDRGLKIANLLRLQGDMAGIAALRMDAFRKSFEMMIKMGSTVHYASLLASQSEKVKEYDKEILRIQGDINKLSKETGLGSSFNGKSNGGKTTNKTTNKTEEKLDEDSYKGAQKALNELEEKRDKMSKTDPGLPKLLKDIEDAKKRVEEIAIAIGKDVPKSEADKLSEFEKSLADAVTESRAKYLNAYIQNPNADNIWELYEAWEKAATALDEYNKGVELRDPLNGTTIETKDTSKELKGDIDKTIKGYSDAINVLQEKLQTLDWSAMGEVGSSTFDEYIQKIIEYKEQLIDLQKTLEEQTLTSEEKQQKAMEKKAKTINMIGDAIGAAGDMFSALGDLADSQEFNVMGIVAKAIATVALSFAQALTTAKSWVDWLVFGVTGMTTMLTMISQIKSATAGGFAEGGIVGGHSYTGDKLLARVNSKEAILNERQQKSLLSQLDNNFVITTNKVEVTGVIRGTDLLLVQKNTNKVLSKAGSSITF